MPNGVHFTMYHIHAECLGGGDTAKNFPKHNNHEEAQKLARDESPDIFHATSVIGTHQARK
jgi:hypothetical protein